MVLWDLHSYLLGSLGFQLVDLILETFDQVILFLYFLNAVFGVLLEVLYFPLQLRYCFLVLNYGIFQVFEFLVLILARIHIQIVGPGLRDVYGQVLLVPEAFFGRLLISRIQGLLLKKLLYSFLFGREFYTLFIDALFELVILLPQIGYLFVLHFDFIFLGLNPHPQHVDLLGQGNVFLLSLDVGLYFSLQLLVFLFAEIQFS